MPKSLTEALELTNKLKDEVRKRVFGMDDVLDYVLISLFAGGHVILQGVPGTAKTRLLKAVAEVVDLHFERIQMTVDLLPLDIIGQEIQDPETGKLGFRKGPIFTSILLADELNRATPKTKSAILEAMAERQVTLTVKAEDAGSQKGDRTIPLPEEFTVFATQNPLDQDGTYPLAEAERDRFLMKVIVGYVGEEEEEAIATLSFRDEPLNTIMDREDILSIRSLIWERVHIQEELLRQVIKMVRLTRPEESEIASGKLKIGGSPRAQQALVKTSKVSAFLKGRDYVLPEDVMGLAYSVLCHRVKFASPKKEDWDGTLREVLDEIFEEVFGGQHG